MIGNVMLVPGSKRKDICWKYHGNVLFAKRRSFSSYDRLKGCHTGRVTHGVDNPMLVAESRCKEIADRRDITQFLL